MANDPLPSDTASAAAADLGAASPVPARRTPFRADRERLDQACVRPPGERLAWLRREAGLSVTQAASEMGLSKAELSRLENGLREITGRHMTRVAAVYGVGFAHVRALLRHDPRGETAVFQLTEPPAPPRARPLPSYGARELRAEGPGASHRYPIEPPTGDVLGPTAYGVRLPADACFGSAHQTMIAVADPEARCVLGDAAVNPFGWSPVAGTTARDGEGHLVLVGENGVLGRLAAGVRVTDLHKIVMMLPGAAVGLPETL